MKFMIVILLSAIAVQAAELMTLAEQNDYMTDVAKEIRRSYWVSGHDDVLSGTDKISKEQLDDYVRQENMSTYEDALDSDEVSSLYRCHYSPKCELYLVSVGGSYWGGYGTTSHFILLYTETRRHFEISHVTYAE